MFCSKCGAEAAADALFCSACGARLHPAAAQPSPASADRSQLPRRVHPRDLQVGQYAHPLDQRSLEGIARFAPVVAVTKAIIKHWDEPMVKGQLLGGTVKVTPAQFGEIHDLAVECAAILNMEVPDIFIRHDPTFNAMTLGVDRPLIILHSSLVEAFAPDELTFVIAHEMGHIKSEHVLYLSAAYFLTMGARGLADRLLGLGSLLIVPALHALQAWMRKAELTCDRAGLICVQDLDLARRSLIKLAVGSRTLFDRLNMDEYLRQADEASRDEYGRVSEFFQTHPHIANRVREIKYYYDSPAYGSLLGTAPGSSGEDSERLAQEAVARARDQINRVGATFTGLLSARSTFERALSELSRVVARYPQTEAARQALYYKGLAHLNLRQGLDAAKAFQSFMFHNPLHELAPEAAWGLAVTYERLLDDPEAASAEYGKLVSDFPESPRAEEAGEALRRLGIAPDTDQALP